MALIIRSAEAQDASNVAAIYVESWNHGFRGLMRPRSLTKDLIFLWERDLVVPQPNHWWVAQEGGELVGFVGIAPSRDPGAADLGELDTIAVRPVNWRQGIGRTLMEVAVSQLVADGYEAAILWTLSDYERGEAFYRSTGWRPDGSVRDDGRQRRYRRYLR